ncbi:hypothetical protein LCGC14_1436160, partial [marine sediment metagenome]
MLTKLRCIISLLAIAGVFLMNSCPCFADETFDLNAYKQKMKEWQDLKYGLFVHWGPCSIAGVEIGWGRKAPRQGVNSTWYPADAIPGEEYD